MKKWFPVTFALAFCVGLPSQAVAQGQPRLDMTEFPRPIAAVDNVWIEELTMLEL